MKTATKNIVVDLLWTLLFAALAAVLLLLTPEQSHGEEANHATPQTVQPLLLEFYSDWCGPCRSMTTTVEALVRDGYAVRRVNIDENPSLARRYGITSIPCFVAVADGQELDRVVGTTSYERLVVMAKRRPAKVDVRFKSRLKVPTPAWRYERPIGHRAAVVRIFCRNGATTLAIGSGTLVKWGGRLVVLTARHVIKGAKNIIIESCTGRTHRARIVKVDTLWDCAVLELDGKPEDVEPAEVELDNDALQREGSRLESCGYGPDGRLACNSGLFLGYRRSTETLRGPDDWIVISGHAREGDSGGPVFNKRGRLVGVLWGTDGRKVVCVQAGRIHALLDAAVPIRAVEQQVVLQRAPTPPKRPQCLPQPPLVTVPSRPSASVAIGGGRLCEETADYAARKPVLPWRGGAQQRDSDLQSQVDALIKALELERQVRLAREATPPATVPLVPKGEMPAAEEFSPVIAGLSIVASMVGGFVIYFAATSKS